MISVVFGGTSPWKLKVEFLTSEKNSEFPESSVMKSTIINSSKEMSAYSDFPPEDTMANYMHNTEMYRYVWRNNQICNVYRQILGTTRCTPSTTIFWSTSNSITWWRTSNEPRITRQLASGTSATSISRFWNHKLTIGDFQWRQGKVGDIWRRPALQWSSSVPVHAEIRRAGEVQRQNHPLA